MAKIYNYKGVNDQFAVLEDPRIASDDFYLFGMKHDKTTLSPIYNAMISTNGDGNSNIGVDNNLISVGTSFNTDWGSFQLCLGKNYTGHWYANPTGVGRSSNYYPDMVEHKNMDPTRRPQRGMVAVNNGSEERVFRIYSSSYSSGSVLARSFTSIGAGDSLSDQITTEQQTGAIANSFGSKDLAWYVYKNNKLFGMSKDSTTGYHFADKAVVATFTWPAISSIDGSAFGGSYQTAQFLGTSDIDGDPLVVESSQYGSTVDVDVFKYGLGTSNTWTTIYNGSNVEPAGSPLGTNAGGLPWGIGASYGAVFLSSTHFEDPRDLTGNTRCWFYPYWDSNGDFHPLVYTWDKPTDTFAREDDITIIGDKSSVHANWTSFMQSDSTYWIIQTSSQYYPCNFFKAETWVEQGTRYVMACIVDPQGESHDQENLRTWTVYDMSSSPENPKELTYHSKIIFPKPVYNYVWLNDAHTLMGVFSQAAFYIYAFNPATGWNQANVISQNVGSIGRDRNDRIWYTVSETNMASTDYPNINLLTPTLPISITITPELESYTYSGSTINTYVNVSAYNASGARIATDVRLLIEGSGMEFVGGATVSTVTTSAVGELQVNIDITSAGYANITASVDV